jgi:hypothetical protein
MYEIVNKGLNNLNGVYSGVARHNWCQKWNQWRNRPQYVLFSLLHQDRVSGP